jgi:hypothetical protein
MSDRQIDTSSEEKSLSGPLGTSAKQAEEAAKIFAAAGVEAMMSTFSPAAGVAAGVATRYALDALKPGTLPSVIPNSFKDLFNDLRHHMSPAEENRPRSLQGLLSPIHSWTPESGNGSPSATDDLAMAGAGVVSGAVGAVGQAVSASKLAEGAVITGAAALGREAGRTEKQIKDLANKVIKEISETPDDVLKHVKENPVTSIIEGTLWIPSIVVDAKLRKYFSK